MNKILITGCLLATAFAAVAMPTKKELAAAQKQVEDVIAPDLKALNAGRKTVKDVADIQMKLAAEAQSEAEKYLLLQSAFKLYSRGEEFDSAAKALTAITRDIKDVPPELITELVDKEFHRGMGQKAPKVLQIFKSARRAIRVRKDLVVAKREVNDHPKDPDVNRKLGECYAELGDWNAALAAFAKADGKLAEIAKSEQGRSGDLKDLADFWWDYPVGRPDEQVKVFRRHAARKYQDAIVAGVLVGLGRVLAEQRVKLTAENDSAFASELKAISATETKEVEPQKDQKMLAQERFQKDHSVYSAEARKEVEELYICFAKTGNLQTVEELIKKYPAANRTGCVLLYAADKVKGDKREELLKLAIEKFDDCYYGDGTRVGAWARVLLANRYHGTGRTEEGRKLWTEIREKYSDCINHGGMKVVDSMPEWAK